MKTNMTEDELDMYFWKKEQDAVKMAEVARDIWKNPEVQRKWLEEAERCRQARWPKDRGYIHLYI